jgi:hypothetical protein
VLYHLRKSQRNLALAGGLELSRRQLQIWEEACSDDRMDQIPEGGIDGEDESSARDKGLDSSNGENWNAQPHSLSLEKVPEPLPEDSEEKGQVSNDEESEDIAPGENKVHFLSDATDTPSEECVNGERDKPT